MYLCAQDRGGADGPPASDPERLLCVVNAPATGDRAAADPAALDELAARVFGRLRRAGLHLGEDPAAGAVRTTPQDFAALFPATGGALYGAASHGWLAAFRRPAVTDPPAGTLPGRGQRAPGCRGADGRAVGTSRGAGRDGRLSGPMNAVTDIRLDAGPAPDRLFPRFDRPIPANGYRWWYVDALSDDGRHGLTLIVFIGSVFSPFYAAARRSGPAEPLDHCAVNVALYGPGRRWALTERRLTGMPAGPGELAIGPNSLRWDGSTLVARIDERSSPLRTPIQGELRIHPESLTEHEVEPGRHGQSPLVAGGAGQPHRGRTGPACTPLDRAAATSTATGATALWKAPSPAGPGPAP